MFFTQEDYRKIEKWLLANSRKDTDFAGAATPLKGNETVVLVQNGKNVKASVKDVVEQLFLLGVSDFVNITDKYGESYISLSQAIELIPYRSRKIGQVVTFLDDTGKWAMFQFQGTRKNQWGTLSLWVDLIDLMTGLTITDSEDIVTETNSANQVALKFADKTYNEADYSGLGRVYLRKSIVNVEDPVTGNVVKMNYLTQSMISKENTIYIIQYDYNLNKQTITIPSGCVLLFEGGSISNGTLIGNETIIVGNSEIFNLTTIEGIWANTAVYSTYFKGEDSYILTNSCSLCKGNTITALYIEDRIFEIKLTEAYTDVLTLPSNTTLITNATIKLLPNNLENYNVVSIRDVFNVEVRGLNIVGDVQTHLGNTGERGHGISIFNAQNIVLENITSSYCWGDGIYVAVGSTSTVGNTNISIKNAYCEYNRRQGISIIQGDNIMISNSKFNNTGQINGTAPMAGCDIEPNNLNQILRNIQFFNCEFINNKSTSFQFYGFDEEHSSDIDVLNCICDGNLGFYKCANITVKDSIFGRIWCGDSNWITNTKNIKLINNTLTTGTQFYTEQFEPNIIATNNNYYDYVNLNTLIRCYKPSNKYLLIKVPVFRGLFRITVVGNLGSGIDNIGIKEVSYFVNSQGNKTSYKGQTNYLSGVLGKDGIVNLGSVIAGDLLLSDAVIDTTNSQFIICIASNVPTNSDELAIKVECIDLSYTAGVSNNVVLNKEAIKIETVTDISSYNFDFKFYPLNEVKGNINLFNSSPSVIPSVGNVFFDTNSAQQLCYGENGWLNPDGTLYDRVVII